MIKKCPICSSSDLKNKFTLKDYTIKKCGSCDIVFNSDFPVEIGYPETFSEHYYKVIQSEAFKPEYLNIERDPSHELFKSILIKVQNINNPDNSNLFEVGYGRGVFLKTAIQNGWNVSGVDISEDACKFVQKHITPNVFSGEFDLLEIKNNSLDAIFFWDSIEHIDRPVDYLEKAHKILNKDGLLVITTDNYSSFLSKLSTLLYNASFGLFKYPVNRFFIPYNSFYFTKQYLEKSLLFVGFTILNIEGIDYPISKMNLNIIERFIIRIIYLLGKIMKSESQILIIAQKKN